MAFYTNSTRLNFHYKEIHKTLIDKRLGLKVSLGLVSGLRKDYAEYQVKNRGFTVCFQEQGMPQNELDHLCASISEQAQSLGIDVLATKSDLPFDNRWYVMGDVRGLVENAQIGRINAPFAHVLYANIIVELEMYET